MFLLLFVKVSEYMKWYIFFILLFLFSFLLFSFFWFCEWEPVKESARKGNEFLEKFYILFFFPGISYYILIFNSILFSFMELIFIYLSLILILKVFWWFLFLFAHCFISLEICVEFSFSETTFLIFRSKYNTFLCVFLWIKFRNIECLCFISKRDLNLGLL